MSAPTPEWTDKIAAWRHSGLSIAAWCRENSESYYRFLYWRDRVPGEQRQEPGKFVAVNIGEYREYRGTQYRLLSPRVAMFALVRLASGQVFNLQQKYHLQQDALFG